ncbi:MarR family transcriptional regulator [Actinoplanes ianthinogenes]|uniref:MarR family transcriptional regulator n=1 Tax=Actinoplanes ianthinogenes TaxID=122358 RepID=A0ABN6CS37_9ACTN|nr:MarR family transcriptional regulator [Actinoplanes ianthinogenes]BCJ48063.1 MarR family transcriptional regulator [Actinoplanes ianthinogenes]GGR06145.1 MarR family transcriptional regulator [Actinoplanes ianthinogenes]
MRDAIDDHVEMWARELPGFDPVREAIIGRLALLGRHLTQVRRSTLDTSGLKQWQFKVLLMLRRAGEPFEQSPSELADRLGLTRGALSARLRPLEEAGLITRAAGDGDRRRVRVRLTPAGLAAWERHVDAESAAELSLLALLTPAEQDQLAAMLRKLVVRTARP